MIIMQRHVDDQVARRSAGGWRPLKQVVTGDVEALQTNFTIALEPRDVGEGESLRRHRGIRAGEGCSSFGGEILSSGFMSSAVVAIGTRGEFLPDHPQNAVDEIAVVASPTWNGPGGPSGSGIGVRRQRMTATYPRAFSHRSLSIP